MIGQNAHFSLTKKERQLIATIFEQSCNRGAVSAQVVSTPKVLKCSVYFTWPDRSSTGSSDQVDAYTGMEEEENDVEAHEGGAAINVPKTKPNKARVTTEQTPAKQASRTHESFTVREPAKHTPPEGKAKVQVQKVDKNTLSACGQPSPTKAPMPTTKLRPPPPPPGGPPPLRSTLTLPPSQGDRQGAWQTVERKKQRSPPGSPTYASVLKAPRGSSEASEVDDDEMTSDSGLPSGMDDDDPCPDQPPAPPLLTHAQVLQWWEEEYVPSLLAEGWTRTEIDKGSRPRSDGKLGATYLTFKRPPKADGVKTLQGWCDR